MPITLDEAVANGLEAFRAKRVHAPLWPEEFCGKDWRKAWRFLLHLRTWNEAESKVQDFPNTDYLKVLCQRWVECREMGELLAVEKCRRMVVSWEFRGLELWAMGQERCDSMIAGETFTSAAKHVWRLEHYYADLRAQYPEWKLPPSKTISFEGERQLTSFSLSNKSSCIAVNGQSKGLQGDGTAIIVLEEFGTYRYGKSMLAQANIITQASATGKKGFVVIVTNASANGQWQAVKKGFLD